MYEGYSIKEVTEFDVWSFECMYVFFLFVVS